ncbi:uncharacterized protein LOC113352413 [Papaver somniferum]|uniref:uncharacterized protein LOC113352413 n=1 Tax=Papaver somniferum TaxID=3469 RepID=UPI000E6FA80C|nr:uncharacterized protein LOC113352413 [Papaver somniferum]
MNLHQILTILPKPGEQCLGAFALKTTSPFQWFLDSGCSRHMTSDLSWFTRTEDYKGGSVTFGDGSSCLISKKGTIKLPGIPEIHDVVYVKGMKAILLSVSQICDKGNIINRELVKGVPKINTKVEGVCGALPKRMQKEQGRKLKKIRSDRGTEFKDTKVYEYCNELGITQQLSAPIIPQSNGPVI